MSLSTLIRTRLLLALSGLLIAPCASAQEGAAAAPGRGAFLQQSLILDLAGAWFSSAAPSQTGGHDPLRSGLTLQGLEWTSTAHVDPYFHFTGVAVFTAGGVEIEEAFAQTTALPASLQLKVGQFLLPVGRLNGQHLHAWHFVDQPLHLGRVYGGEGGRALGLLASWLAPLPWSCEVALAGTAAAGAEREDAAGGHGSGGVIGSVDDALATLQVKQFVSLGDDWGVQFGVAGQLGALRGEPWAQPGGAPARVPGEPHDDAKLLTATDLLLRWRPLGDPERRFAALLVEALRVAPPPHGHAETSGTHADAGLLGGAAQFIVGIDPRWEAGVRAEFIEANDNVGSAWSERRHTALLAWKPTEFSRLRLQAHLARSAPATGALDGPARAGAWQYGTVLALEVFTGDHAAHPW